MRRTKVHLLAVLAAGALAITLDGCGRMESPWPDREGKKVMAVFPPLYSFAANVAGDHANLLCLLETTGPHDYILSAGDAHKLHQADLFLINGLELDSTFAGRLANNAGNPHLKVIPVGEAIPRSQLRSVHEGPQGGHHHGEYDPHVWLGIPEAIVMVEKIRDVMKENDPANGADYERNAAAYMDKLHQLHAYGRKQLADKKDRNLISFHDSLFYFARALGLNIAGVIEISAGSEPGQAHLADLADLCRKKNIRLITVEPQYPKTTSAAILLKEIQQKGVADAVLVEIDPLETAEPEDLDTPAKVRDFYERKMKQNIDNLAKHMR